MAKRVPHLDRSLTSADTLTPSDGRRRFHATVLFVFVLSVFFSFYSASFIAAFLSTLEGLVVVPFYDRNSPFESVCLSFFSFFFEGGGLLRSCKNEAPLVNRIEKKKTNKKQRKPKKKPGAIHHRPYGSIWCRKRIDGSLHSSNLWKANSVEDLPTLKKEHTHTHISLSF